MQNLFHVRKEKGEATQAIHVIKNHGLELGLNQILEYTQLYWHPKKYNYCKLFKLL